MTTRCQMENSQENIEFVEWGDFLELLERSDGYGYFGWVSMFMTCPYCATELSIAAPMFTPLEITCPRCVGTISMNITRQNSDGPSITR